MIWRQVHVEKSELLHADEKFHQENEAKVRKQVEAINDKLRRLAPDFTTAQTIGDRDQIHSLGEKIDKLKSERSGIEYAHWSKLDKIKQEQSALNAPYQRECCLELLATIKKVMAERSFLILSKTQSLKSDNDVYDYRILTNYPSIRDEVKRLSSAIEKIRRLTFSPLMEIRACYEETINGIPETFESEEADADENTVRDLRESEAEKNSNLEGSHAMTFFGLDPMNTIGALAKANELAGWVEGLVGRPPKKLPGPQPIRDPLDGK